jgi:hypothetical protein
LNLTYVEALSNFAFNFNLHHYIQEQERLRQVRMAEIEAQAMRPGSNRGGGPAAGMADATSVRRCSLNR